MTTWEGLMLNLRSIRLFSLDVACFFFFFFFLFFVFCFFFCLSLWLRGTQKMHYSYANSYLVINPNKVWAFRSSITRAHPSWHMAFIQRRCNVIHDVASAMIQRCINFACSLGCLRTVTALIRMSGQAVRDGYSLSDCTLPCFSESHYITLDSWTEW